MVTAHVYNPIVTTIACTPEPAQLIVQTATNTMKGIFAKESELSESGLCARLLNMGHTSVFEHANITFLVENLSRAGFDQLRTHRIGSFTASSTHYQDHSDYPVFLPYSGYIDSQFRELAIGAVEEYSNMVKVEGFKPEDARQLLPLCVGTRSYWTVNARSLINFLTIRLCMRNTDEMVLLAGIVAFECRKWFPELFKHVTPPCKNFANNGKGCNQGKMQCNWHARVAELTRYANEA